MWILVVAIASLFELAFSNSIADQFLDSILYDPLEQQIKASGLDPAPLPDLGIPFTLPIIPVSGRVDFTNGIFNGLSRIRRLVGCEGPTIDTIQEVRLECNLNFFGMNVVYDGNGRLEQLPPVPFQVTAYVNETHVKSVISGAPASLNGRLKLLQMEKFGDINVRLSNLGLFQYLYNVVEEKFRNKIKEMVTEIILAQFPVPFGRAIAKAAMPGLSG